MTQVPPADRERVMNETSGEEGMVRTHDSQLWFRADGAHKETAVNSQMKLKRLPPDPSKPPFLLQGDGVHLKPSPQTLITMGSSPVSTYGGTVLEPPKDGLVRVRLTIEVDVTPSQLTLAPK